MALTRVRERVHLGLLQASHQAQSLLMLGQNGQADPYEMQIMEDLQTEGVHVTSIDRLTPAQAPAIRAAIKAAAALLRDESAQDRPMLWRRGVSSTDLQPQILLARMPSLYLLGLCPAVLRLAQRYLRLPVAYHGAVVRHSLLDAVNAGPRLWHQDAEDFHVVRVVMYLNDVWATGGPFEYLPRSLGITHKEFPASTSGITNEQMRSIVPLRLWKRCMGPAGTLIIADTAKVFHHESMQTERARTVLMIGYSSRRPKGMPLAMAHFPVEQLHSALRALVPAENRDHVFGWRRATST